MNDTSCHYEPIAPDEQPDELDALVRDALAAPPVPMSLLRRLDKGIEVQWGESPGLVNVPVTHALAAALSKVSALRVWPLAASLAAILLFAIVFVGGSTSYAWTTVLDAIAKQPLVQLGQGDTRRQLSFADSADISESEKTRRLVAFLLSETEFGRDPEALTGLRVVRESWARQGDAISLRVQFETAAADRFDLNLLLDPETSLPRIVKVADETLVSQPLPLTYPSIAVAPTKTAGQPKAVSVIDVVGEQLDATQVAVESSTPGSPTAAPTERPDATAEPADAAATSLPLGAATNWRPVAIVERSDAEVVQRIDAVLENLWKQQSVEPAAAASDQEMLRRVYLDLAGRTPTVSEARAYFSDARSDRYERVVERLLESSDHASAMATVWRDFLIPEGVDLSAFGGREAFDRWLADRFARNVAYDETVRGLLLAEGRLSQSGPLLFYTALKLDPDQLAARTSRVFLGMRLECAQCHDHPFEPWTQEDFWSLAAFFAQISRPKGELEMASRVMQVRDIGRGEVTLPETQTIIAPRFLGQAGPISSDGDLARREQLARWLTSAENPYFARATVNRVWAHLFGRGIVDPVDDFGVTNQPIAPELLDLLASQLISSGFDLRRLFRSVALSRAYRLSSGAGTPDPRRQEYFAQMNVKALTASQLYDCITVATLLGQAANDNTANFAISRFGNSRRELFLQQFAAPNGDRVEYFAGIPQALTLMNGELVTAATDLSSSGLLKSIEAPFFTFEQRIEVLFLATLSRVPRPSELSLLRDAASGDLSPTQRSEWLADVLWALLNSAEFTLNH